MTLPTWTRMLSPWGWLAALVVLLLLLGLGWWWATSPSREAQKAANARAVAAQAQGTTLAAKDAVGVVISNQSSQAAIDAQTEKSRAEILNAPGAGDPIAPGVGDAGRRAICMRKSAASLPECVALRRSGSR